MTNDEPTMRAMMQSSSLSLQATHGTRFHASTMRMQSLTL